jgi:hypothetical protein
MIAIVYKGLREVGESYIPLVGCTPCRWKRKQEWSLISQLLGAYSLKIGIVGTCDIIPGKSREPGHLKHGRMKIVSRVMPPARNNIMHGNRVVVSHHRCTLLIEGLYQSSMK